MVEGGGYSCWGLVALSVNRGGTDDDLDHIRGMLVKRGYEQLAACEIAPNFDGANALSALCRQGGRVDDPATLFVVMHLGRTIVPGAGLPADAIADPDRITAFWSDFEAARIRPNRLPAIGWTDDPAEVWACISEVMDAGAIERLRLEIASTLTSFRTPFPVVRTLNKKVRRAKTDLIEYDGGLAVCKVYKVGNERSLERELRALAVCSDNPFVPRVLERGDNWFVCPFYSGPTLRQMLGRSGLLPIPLARTAMEVLRSLHADGVAHLDFHAENVILDPASGPIVVDFERAHIYPTRPARFEEGFDIVGPPSDYTGARGRNPANYERRWLPLIGLSLRGLLHDPLWIQHVKRIGFVVCRAAHRTSRRAARFSSKLFSGRAGSL